MFEVSVGKWSLVVDGTGLPELHDVYLERAKLVNQFALTEGEGKFCFLAVLNADGECALVVEQRYSPAGSGFQPGAMLVPETSTLFVGAGERLLAYRLDPPSRIWEDSAAVGFWGWSRHGDCVLMSAELEFAAFDLVGKKLWTTFVEPPWTFRVERELIVLDVMGTESRFPLLLGPAAL